MYSLYKIANTLYKKKVPVFPQLIQFIMRVFLSTDIPYTCEIGKGIRFAHGGMGVVLHKRTVIGESCIIYQNVTIGGNGKGKKNANGVPIIGSNVKIYAGAVVIGSIIIGDNSIIGANAVVNKSVPSDSVVVGIPAKVVGESF